MWRVSRGGVVLWAYLKRFKRIRREFRRELRRSYKIKYVFFILYRFCCFILSSGGGGRGGRKGVSFFILATVRTSTTNIADYAFQNVRKTHLNTRDIKP